MTIDANALPALINSGGVYHLSLKGKKGHAMAVDARGPYHFYDPDQHWFTFQSKERFTSVMSKLIDKSGRTFGYIDYATWAWYQVI
jgi:hypothetical protein